MGQAYTALVNDPSSIYWNPAAMSVIKNGNIGLMLKHGTKTYSPAIDNNSMIESWKILANSVTDLGFLGLVFPFHAGIANTTLGVGIKRYIAFPQEVNEEIIDIHDNTYELYYNHDGALSEITVAISVSLMEDLSLGGAFSFYTGEEKLNLESSGSDSVEEVVYDITQEYSRTSFHMGIRYQYNSNWIFGLKLNLPFSLEIKKTIGLTEPVINDELLSFPLYFNLAAAYLIREDIKISADYYYRPWNRVKIISMAYEHPITEYTLHALHIGGEYITSISDIPLAFRLGYYSNPTLYTTSSNMQRINHVITTGIGYPGEWITINFGLEWIPSQYESGSAGNLIPGIPSHISNISISTHTFQISFDLIAQIT
jgi:hypothetical protein